MPVADHQSTDALAQWRAASARVRDTRAKLIDAEIAAGQRDRARLLPIVVLTVLSVLILAAAGLVVTRYLTAPTVYSNADFVRVATERVGLLLEADSNDGTRAERILAGATGEFHDAFAQSADAYSEYIGSASTRGAGSIDAVALARRDGDSAIMLVAANLRVTTTTGTDTVRAPFRLRVLMTPENGVLKIARIEVLR